VGEIGGRALGRGIGCGLSIAGWRFIRWLLGWRTVVVAISQPRPLGEADRRRQVDEADGPAAGESPPHRLPLRRVFRKRIEARVGRIVLRVDQQRDRRLHRIGLGERYHVVGIGRPLDQHDRRIGGVERRQHATRRPRPVMADAEEVETV
jgi:hypothetical protein